jgi:hypothetical protein
MNVNGTACRDAGTIRSNAIWALNRDAQWVTSVHSACEWAKNFLENRRGESYTSSVNEAFKSFHSLRIPIGMAHEGGLQLSVDHLEKAIGNGMPCSVLD